MKATPAEEAEARIEDRLHELELVIFGIRNQNGLVEQLRGLRLDFQNWRDEDLKRRSASSRVLLAAMATAFAAMLGTIFQLVIALSTGGHP